MQLKIELTNISRWCRLLLIMQELSPRQIEILKTIIHEYTQEGEAVGSEILDKKYNLGVSPATIRNEMVELTKKGYLNKEHFSSGRVPTAKAFRFYIQNLMEEKELSTADEVSYKSDIWDFRNEMHQLLQNATRVLARRTNLMAVTTTNLGDVYYFGVNNILNNREFWDIDRVSSLFERFNENSFSNLILNEFKRIEDQVVCMFGNEFVEEPQDDRLASVFGEFKGKNLIGAIGVIGPKRMHYEVIIPNVRYFTHLINSILEEQAL